MIGIGQANHNSTGHFDFINISPEVVLCDISIRNTFRLQFLQLA